MTTPGSELRWRDALVDAIVPAPVDGLPPLAAIERRDFWPAFDRAAPLLLRLGFAVATLVIVGVAPLLFGYLRPWRALDAAARDDVLGRVGRLPGGAQLLQVAKLVACFVYFRDAGVQATVRGER